MNKEEYAEHLKRCCQGTCPSIATSTQYDHSLARFNDTSAQTAAAMQQSFAMQQATWGAHLLKLQADITKVEQ